jgi:hypothetical protein
MTDFYDKTNVSSERIQKRQTVAFILLAIGALLGFISCMFTIINPVPALYYWVLYGVTTVSVLIIFIGLYYLFE